MINSKKGSTAIVNIISVIVTIVIILSVGFVYYVFFAPDELILEEIAYDGINKKHYEIDKEFEKGLDTIVDFNYTDDELDMHRDLKDYYQGREDPFAQSDNRNTILNLDGELDNEEKITSSNPELLLPDLEDEFDIFGSEESSDGTSNNISTDKSTIIGF